MRLFFWRARHVDLARRAKESSERDRNAVDELVTDLAARRRVNKFAPLLAEAFRRRDA